MATTEISHVIAQYHAAVDAILRGNAELLNSLYSHRDDIILATPFGPPIVGWTQVSEQMAYHATRFREGNQISTELLAQYVSPELFTIMEIEHAQVKVGGRDELSPIHLRVTSIFRLEDGTWKLVSRHADPISSFDQDGPLRNDH